jgi:hypothetical protein
MGTRSFTRVYDGMPADKPKAVVQMYRHMDGYPSGHGSELAGFLAGMTVISGISPCNPPTKQANGAGCLAAQMVAEFKDGIGSIYIEPVGENNWVDYKYSIFAKEGQPLLVRVQSNDRRVLFEGSVDEFTQYCLKDGNE